MQSIRLIAAVLVFWSLYSCTGSKYSHQTKAPVTNRVYFKGLMPGPVPMDVDIIRVGVVNSSVNKKVNSGLRWLGGAVMGETSGTDDYCSRILVETIVKELKATDRFVLVRSYEADLRKPAGELLTPEEVTNFTQQHYVDLLIELRSFDSDHYKRKEEFETGELNSDGTPEIDYYVSMDSDVSAKIRTYHGRTGKLLDEASYHREILSDKVTDGKLETYFSPLDKRAWVNDMAREIGAAQVPRYFPSFEQITRLYRDNGCDSLEIAAALVKLDEWALAGEIWVQLSLTAKDTIAANAMYNMAVYNERIGDVSKAVFWAERAVDRVSFSGYIWYLEQIRIREQAVLFEQRLALNIRG